MTIYGVPEYRIGKNYPGQGPFRNFTPKLVGPGSGKVKILIRAGQYIGRQLYARPTLSGSITGIAIGTGLTVNRVETNYKFNQALRYTKQSYRSRFKYYRKRGRRGSDCSCRHNCC